jgi:hypothetical protein
MSDVVQIDAALVNVDFIQDAVVANSQFEFRSALKALVREVSQSCAHLVHLALHCIANGCRKGIKCFGEGRRPNLKRGGHDLFRLPRRVFSGGDLAPGLVQLGFRFVGELKMILEVIINPLADFLDFLPRQFWNRCLNIFDRAHS